jgi:hypothetical protein
VLIRISSSYFVAGIILEDKVVVKCAPILRYMRGWSGSDVINYCNKKGWHIEVLRDS